MDQFGEAIFSWGILIWFVLGIIVSIVSGGRVTLPGWKASGA